MLALPAALTVPPGACLPQPRPGELPPVRLLPGVRPQVSCEVCRSREDLPAVPGEGGGETIRQRHRFKRPGPFLARPPGYLVPEVPHLRQVAQLHILDFSFFCSPEAQLSFTEKPDRTDFAVPPDGQTGLLWLAWATLLSEAVFQPQSPGF